ncbi:MAG: SulP family inorganic anion transporter [Acidimicrobiales bacterium]
MQGDPGWWRSPRQWRIEVLAAMVVGIALIPEAISFSVVAHVAPQVGLFASFVMAMTISIVGGRRAMISAATGSTALVLAPLSRHYGLHYLIAAVLLAGVVQIVLGLLGAAKLMRYVPRAVSVGFVNALGILLFLAQLSNLRNVSYLVYVLVLLGLGVITLFPRVNRTIPAPLIAIVLVTTIAIIGHFHGVPTVGDKGTLPSSLPLPTRLAVPMTLRTLHIIALPAVGMAVVGLLETQMTARLVDDITSSGSNKRRESIGQGIANIIAGIFGGMGGCAMIGQTMINLKSGARTRMSTFLAGVFLLILVVVMNPLVSKIPMAALVAVMFVVAYNTFNWESIAPSHLRRLPKAETSVMIITVILTVATGNLSIGVIAGSIMAALLFAHRVQGQAQVVRVTKDHHRWNLHLPFHHVNDADLVRSGATRTPRDLDGQVSVYQIRGELFFASSSDLSDHFDYVGDSSHIVIDLSESHIWDASTVAALDQVISKYAHHGKSVEIVGMNDESRELHDALTGRLASDHS